MLIWLCIPFFPDPCWYTFGLVVMVTIQTIFTEAEWSVVKCTLYNFGQICAQS